MLVFISFIFNENILSTYEERNNELFIISITYFSMSGSLVAQKGKSLMLA